MFAQSFLSVRVVSFEMINKKKTWRENEILLLSRQSQPPQREVPSSKRFSFRKIYFKS